MVSTLARNAAFAAGTFLFCCLTASDSFAVDNAYLESKRILFQQSDYFPAKLESTQQRQEEIKLAKTAKAVSAVLSDQEKDATTRHVQASLVKSGLLKQMDIDKLNLNK